MSDHIFIGGGGASYGAPQKLLLDKENRHGLVAGATGTGKTVTLQIMAEGFSAAGVPVFLSDVKGDLSGLAVAGSADFKLHDAFTKRATTIGLDLAYDSFPVTFWDLFGQQGHPIRATVAEMGPLLLSRLMELTEVQEGVLNVAFRVADEEGLPLLDLKDLRALLVWVGQNAKDLSLRYGNVASSSVGAIQRQLLILENQGGDALFGEPALELADMMRCHEGRGEINILAADQLMGSPRLYATFLLWLLSELFEELPEVGNPDKPKLVFFFDEAHLLFDDAPKALVDNRVQHALRAFTAKDRKELKTAAETYRDNPAFDTAEAIQEVGTGEAVTSFLDAKGIPTMVERTLIRPPSSQLGPIDGQTRRAIMAASDMAGKYDQAVDRVSAFEMLSKRADAAAKAAEEAEKAEALLEEKEREFKAARRFEGSRSSRTSRKSSSNGFGSSLASVVAKELKGTTGRRLVRGILGNLFKGR